MNKERGLKVANLIEANAEHFNMVEGVTDAGLELKFNPNRGTCTLKGDCNSTACVAGFAYLLAVSENKVEEDLLPENIVTYSGSHLTWGQVRSVAQDYLGLNSYQAFYLFQNSVSHYFGLSRDEEDLKNDRGYFNSNQEYASFAARRVRDFFLKNEKDCFADLDN